MRRGVGKPSRCPHLCLFLLCSRIFRCRLQAPRARHAGRPTPCRLHVWRVAFGGMKGYAGLMLRTRFSLFAALAVLAAASLPAVADDAKKKDAALPGVDSTYSIVAPEPEPDEPPADTSGTKKFGKWELTVSGYVWVQVGSGSHGDGR